MGIIKEIPVTRKKWERTRYLVAPNFETINELSSFNRKRDEPAIRRIIRTFKEVNPENMTASEWQDLLLSGLMIGVTESALDEFSAHSETEEEEPAPQLEK